MLLLAIFFWQQTPVLPVTPSIPVVLPDEPQSHFLRGAAERFTLYLSTRKFSDTTGRVYSGGGTFEVNSHMSVSLGWDVKGISAGAVIRPVPRKR